MIERVDQRKREGGDRIRNTQPSACPGYIGDVKPLSSTSLDLYLSLSTPTAVHTKRRVTTDEVKSLQ